MAANGSDVPTTLHASGTLALGPGSRLDVGGGSEVSAAALALAVGAGVTLLDAMSGILLGAGTAQAGALTVGAGGVLSGSGGTIVASVVLDGALDVSGALALDGVLTGSGSVLVGGGDLAVVDAVAFAGSIALGSVATLTLQQGDAPAAALAMNGATVDLRGIAWGNGLTATYDAVDGLLTLGAATLDVGAGAAARDFAATHDPLGGTLLTEHRAPVWQATAAGAGGDWADAGHWGAEGVPLAGDPVAIGPGVTAAGPWTVTVDGHATAERLTLASATLAVGGSLGIADTLAVQSGALDVGAAGSVVVGAAGGAVAGAIAVGAGATLTATDSALGNVAVEGGSVSLHGGGGGTLSGTGTVALDNAEVGAVSGFAGTLAVAGMVTVDAGGAPAGPVRFAESGTAAGLDLRGVAWQAGETPAYDAASGAAHRRRRHAGRRRRSRARRLRRDRRRGRRHADHGRQRALLRRRHRDPDAGRAGGGGASGGRRAPSSPGAPSRPVLRTDTLDRAAADRPRPPSAPRRRAAGAHPARCGGARRAGARPAAVARSCGGAGRRADPGEIPGQWQHRGTGPRASPRSSISMSNWIATTSCWPRRCRRKPISTPATVPLSAMRPGRWRYIPISRHGAGSGTPAPR